MKDRLTEIADQTGFELGRRLATLAAGVAAVLAAIALTGERSEAAFPGENGLILFDTMNEPCGAGGLYIDNLPGNRRRLLVEGHGGRFSPNGRRILFDSCDGVTTDIEIIDVDGGNRRVVLDLDRSVDSPAFAPDRERIVVSIDGRPTGNGYGDLWTLKLDGSGLRRITNDRSGENDPEWSPNGNYIVFSERGEIKTIRPDGTRERTVADGIDPAISPNSHLIAFERFGEIWVSGPTGARERRLVKSGGDGGAFGPEVGQSVFSPNGKWVLYSRVSYASYGPGTVSWSELCKVRLNGRDNQRVRRTGRPIDEFNADWQSR